MDWNTDKGSKIVCRDNLRTISDTFLYNPHAQNPMPQKFTVVLEPEGSTVTSHCLECEVFSQGKTHGAALDNIKEALKLYLKQNPKAKPKSIEIAVVEVP